MASSRKPNVLLTAGQIELAEAAIQIALDKRAADLKWEAIERSALQDRTATIHRVLAADKVLKAYRRMLVQLEAGRGRAFRPLEKRRRQDTTKPLTIEAR